MTYDRRDRFWEQVWCLCVKITVHFRILMWQVLYKHLDRMNVTLSTDCPWTREKDMYLVHEQHKKKIKNYEWKSLYSNKLFKSEYYIGRQRGEKSFVLLCFLKQGESTSNKWCHSLVVSGWLSFRQAHGQSSFGQDP